MSFPIRALSAKQELGASRAPFCQEIMVVGRCRHIAELPYEQRNLPAMVGRMVDGVLNELAQSIGIRIQDARRIQLCLRRAMQVTRIGVVVVTPSASQARET